MKLYKELDLYLNDSNNEVRENFYRQCFNIVTEDKYNYNDGKNFWIDGFRLNSGRLVYYANKYFFNYASDNEKKQYLSNIEFRKQFEIRKEYLKLGTDEEKLAYIYKWCLELNWSMKKLVPVAMALYIMPSSIRKKGVKYAIDYLGFSSDEMKNILEDAYLVNMREFYDNSKYNSIFKSIYMENDINKVVDILEKNQVCTSDMLHRVENYVKLYKDLLDKDKSNQEIIDSLVSKIKYYSNCMINKNKQIKKEEKKKEIEAKNTALLTIANMYISNLVMFILKKQGTSYLETIEGEFCECINIDYKTLREYKKIVEKNNKELFIEYFNVSKVSNDLRGRQVLLTVLKLKNILLDDSLYKETFMTSKPKFNFNSIDYYRMFDIPLNELYKSVDNIDLSVDDIKLIKYFSYLYYLKFYYELDDRMINSILNNIKESRCKKDENGFPIRGTGIVLSRDEKIQILDYLNRNNIPGINEKVYNDACEKYMDGDLFETRFMTRKLK